MAETTTVRIRHVAGPVRRELKGYVWEEGNGFTAEVDIPTAAELLTYPSGAFSLAERPTAAVRKALADALGVKPENVVLPAEPDPAAPPAPTVSNIAGGRRALELAALGITEARHLAALDDEGIERLASASGASRDEVRAWVTQAK